MHRTRSKVGIGNASDTAWFAHITTTDETCLPPQCLGAPLLYDGEVIGSMIL